MKDRAELDLAYRRADYRVRLPAGELQLAIGRPDPVADARLAQECGCRRHWALLTPCNPRSERLDDAENIRLYNVLQDELAALSQAWQPAVHRDPDGLWPDEPAFLLVDPLPELVIELAQRYRQNAVVTGELRRAPQLLWVDPAAL